MALGRREFLCALGGAIPLVLSGSLDSSAVEQRLPEHRIALVIGNARYRGGRLRSTDKDAKEVSSFLRNSGFLVTERYDCSFDEFTKTIAEYSRSAALADVAVFFYAGHGLQIDNTNYLVPTDLSINNIDISGVDTQLVPVRWAIDASGGSDTVGVVILNACRDNPFVSALRASAPYSVDKHRILPGLAPGKPNERSIISYATAENEVAADGRGYDLSPYTRSFLSYAQQEDITVQETFDRVITSVCNITTPAGVPNEKPRNDVLCQRPAVYTSLGAVPVYWKSRPDGKVRYITSPIVADVKMADPEDPAADRLLGNNHEFSFKYLWRPPVADRTEARIIPDLEYFQSAQERPRPLIIAKDVGYYAPDEGSTAWSLSYPIVDLIARRISGDEVSIDELIIEAKSSKLDTTPYATIVVPGTGVAELTIVNQSWGTISEARLEFDVIDRAEYTDDDIRSLLDKRQEKPFQFSKTVKQIRESETVSLAELIRPVFDEMRFYEFYSSFPSGLDVTISPSGSVVARQSGANKKPVVTPDGFDKWYVSMRKELEGFDFRSLLIIGRITTTNQSGQAVADFGARLALVLPGVGGGTVDYDLTEYVSLPIDGADHTIRRKISTRLRKGKETLRVLLPLVSKQSSFHKIRISLTDTTGKLLYQTPWADTHIVVSRNDKRAALGSNFSRY